MTTDKTTRADVPDITRDAREDWRLPLADQRGCTVCQELVSLDVDSLVATIYADSGGICVGSLIRKGLEDVLSFLIGIEVLGLDAWA